MKKTICLLLLVCCAFGLKAQTNYIPGYIITHENDTLHGLIDYRGDARNARRCDFRENEQSPVQEYLPGSIKSYRFNESKYYVSRTVARKGANEPVFLEFLVNGISDLFYYSDGKYNHFYIEKEDGKMYVLTNELHDVRINDINYRKNSRKYIGTLKVAFADNPELYPMIDHARLEHKSLINISRKYHDNVCEGEQCVVYQKKLPAIRISLGAAVAANSAQLALKKTSTYWTTSFEPALYPTLKLLMNTTMPKVSDKLSLEVSVEAGKADFNGERTDIWDVNTIHYTEEIELQTILLKGNIGLKYTFPRGKIRPVVLVGANYTRVKNKEELPFLPTIERMAGIQGDLGLDFHHLSAFTPFVRLGYESLLGSERYTWQTNSTLKTIRINAGICF